jgi:TatD DNase family protein
VDFTSLKYINIHTHRKPRLTNEIAVRNAFHLLNVNQINQLPYAVSVGLHPWHIIDIPLAHIEWYVEYMITHCKHILAVGEIGIDRAISIDLGLQKKYFECQLRVAQRYRLPVIVHAVKSYSDIAEVISRYPDVTYIFHQYQGNTEQCRQLLKFNTYFSFGVNLFHTKATEALTYLPADRFFLETDQASHIHIGDVYYKASSILKTDMHELMKNQMMNFEKIFEKKSN